MNTHTYLIANAIVYLFLFSIWNGKSWKDLPIKMVLGGMLIATIYLLCR